MGATPPASPPADTSLAQSGSTGPQRRLARHWWPLAIVVAGAMLRILYAAGSDVRNVHDDHFEVVRIMLEQQRWPKPDEAWEAYQPPLYYVLSALTYVAVSAHTEVPPPPQITAEQYQSARGVPCLYPWHAAGRKAIQLLSTLSGIVTLALVGLTLRRLFPASPGVQSIGVAFVAFLPRHIYVSGMATNDAMTYLWATLSFYALVRALLPELRRESTSAEELRRPTTVYRWWLLAGVGAALAMWTKQYGLAALGVLLAAGCSAVLLKNSARRNVFRGAALAAVVTLLLGVGPYVRMWRLTGNPLASSFTLRPHTINLQLPGALSGVSFGSLRLPSLLARPWNHISTVDSYWTAILGELWFDYGTSVTTFQYRPWLMQLARSWQDQSLGGRECERRSMIWDTTIVPAAMLWQARFLIALGILPTALILVGLGATWRRAGVPLSVVLATSLALGLATPLYQTLRQPFRSSMKATFMLCALPAMAVLVAMGWQWLMERRYGRWLAWLVVADLVLLAAVASWHFLDLGLVFPGTPDYFARRDPL